MDKINFVLLLLTSFMMFANSDELISSTEVPTTAINNQNMTKYTAVPSVSTSTEEETSTSSGVSSSTAENQLKLSNVIKPVVTVTSEATMMTTDVSEAEITSSSHVDLITTTTTTIHSSGNEEEEESVVSFGIRSFTVEVKGGDEKVSTVLPSTAEVSQTTTMPAVVISEVAASASETTTTKAPHSAPVLLKSDLNILFNDDGANNGNDEDDVDDTETTVLLLNSQENEIANEIQIDKKLDNGLYRIKIGEITTDEFSNGLNFNEANNEDKLHHGKSKVNIDDFFPSKIEDFRPIIEISNEKLLKEKDALHNEQVVLREEIMLNEEPMAETKSGTRINTSNVASTNIEIELIDESSTAAAAAPAQVEAITRVEVIATEEPLPKINFDDIFIPRRSKKFDPKSSTQGLTRLHDFAMTKFNQKNLNVTLNQTVSGKPEYSTTKFYNSKELYNEILHKESKGAASTLKTTIKPSIIVREKLLSTNKIPIDASSRLTSTVILEPLTTPTSVTAASTTQQQQQRPFTAHPPRIVSRLEEKLNQLDCDIQNLSADSTVWRGNETHELNLPSTTPEDCSSGSDCLPMIISWEGSVDIQSGDVLIVQIDDKLLISSLMKKNKTEDEIIHRNSASVYQVTRLGHEHCDITEGELLDITPLVVDGKKLVTLYDKDLTEGINLLIVVSELWDQQCVRLRVNVKSDNCGDSADCSGKGICFSNVSMESFFCECCTGFAGQHCEEIDACTPSPCTNNGICVDLSQGHEGNSYQCLCPYGYTGKNCQYEADPCNPSQCLNGGTCISNTTHFRCECAPSFTGPLCQHNLNECESSPCVHGICVDQEDGFRCFCQPGFSGDLCNFEYNECDSNPCLNGGQCIDHIGGFSCQCTKGYQGKRCHIKNDFCANNPCEDGYRCVDHGDEYSCVCPGSTDHNVPDCHDFPRTLCTINPCKNAGTCWTSNESFYCACRPGFTGKLCEDDFVIDTVVSSSELLSDVADGNVIAWGELKDIQQEEANSTDIHNAYMAAGILAGALLILAVVVTICHCKVTDSYRRFTVNQRHLIPYFLRRRGKKDSQEDNNKHWLSGKNSSFFEENHINLKNNQQPPPPHSSHRATSNLFNRPLQMNLENDMYYTVDFSESSSQQSPLIH